MKWIHAVGNNFRTPQKAEEYPEFYDTCSVLMEFENGAVADVTASRASFERARYMHVFQPDGYVSVDFMNARVKTYRKEKPVVNAMSDLTVNYPKVEKQLPITSEILHFMDCIRTAKTPAPSGEKGSKAFDLALHILDVMNRFDIPKTGHLHTPKPLQALNTVARAAQAVFDETLGQLKGDK